MIPKQYTDDAAFQKEMDALLHIRQSGGHPNICVLKENFEQRGNYYLVLDLINGGELFDHLISNGTYSEADAARLVKEIASALAFLHGTGLVHADMKPENLMLSTPNTSDSVSAFGLLYFFAIETNLQTSLLPNLPVQSLIYFITFEGSKTCRLWYL